MGLSLSLSPSPSPSITMDFGLLDQAPVCYRRSHNIWTRILAKTRLILAKNFLGSTAETLSRRSYCVREDSRPKCRGIQSTRDSPSELTEGNAIQTGSARRTSWLRLAARRPGSRRLPRHPGPVRGEQAPDRLHGGGSSVLHRADESPRGESAPSRQPPWARPRSPRRRRRAWPR